MYAVAVEPQILKTKLYPPRLPEIVARERLLTEMDKTRSCKLVTIVAGAGYGNRLHGSYDLRRCYGRSLVKSLRVAHSPGRVDTGADPMPHFQHSVPRSLGTGKGDAGSLTPVRT